MKMKVVRHLITGIVISVIIAGCSESSPPKDLSDVAKQAGDVIATTDIAATSDDAVGGPPITGADAVHPDDKPVVAVNGELPPLPIEETGRVETLPESYPESWVMVDEASFLQYVWRQDDRAGCG